MTDRERFEALCVRDRETLHLREGIGTLSEKRLHRIIKSYISDDVGNHEIAVGKYVADVFLDGEISEIQTKAFERLLPKLKYYLGATEYPVTVICPIIRNKRLIRIEPETGEILRNKLSPSHGKAADVLPCLYGIREVFPNGRLKIRLLMIDAEEYRYSERVRYRRSGAYECELFPVTLADDLVISSADELRRFIPADRQKFTAAEYSEFIGAKGRKLYSSLSLLYSVGLLDRQKDGKKYIYCVR